MRRTPFRSVFDDRHLPGHEQFCVEVIGYRQPMRAMVDTPRGVGWWFVFMFYSPVRIRTAEGMHAAPEHSICICDPHFPIFHGMENRPWKRSWVRCDGTDVKGFVSEAGLPVRTMIPFADHRENERHLLELHREMTHPHGADARNVRDLFRIWLRSIQRESLLDPRDRVPESLLTARRFVEEHYREGFTLDELAEECALSRSYLCKGFQRHFSTSPIAMAIQLRLSHARELLDSAEMSVTQIADECGFSDVFYFSRTFKQHVGMSPRAYRTHSTRL